MNNKKWIPYCYIIGWSKLNKLYCGIQWRTTGHIANPENLWVNYFTSSKIVKEFRKINGEPDIFNIIATFNNKNSCENFEEKFLQFMDVRHDAIWLNLSDRKGASWPIGRHLTEEHKHKIRKNSRHTKPTEEHKIKIRNAHLGKPKSEEHKRNMRKPKSEEHKRNLSLIKMGSKHKPESIMKMKISKLNMSEETKQNISEGHKNKNIYEFYNIEYGTFVGIQYDFRVKYKLNSGCLSKLIDGRMLLYRGWKFIGKK